MPERERIEFDRLVDWVEGRLPTPEAAALEEILATADEETRADVAWLRAFARISEDTVIASPPSEVGEVLTKRFDDHARDRRPPDLLKRLVARLTFDGGLQPAFGLRSAGTQESRRQLIYSTDVADVALNLRPRVGEDGFDVYGQVLLLDDSDPASFVVQILDGEVEVATTATNDLGEFSFKVAAPGAYDILVSGDRAEIRLRRVELRP